MTLRDAVDADDAQEAAGAAPGAWETRADAEGLNDGKGHPWVGCACPGWSSPSRKTLPSASCSGLECSAAHAMAVRVPAAHRTRTRGRRPERKPWPGAGLA